MINHLSKRSRCPLIWQSLQKKKKKSIKYLPRSDSVRRVSFPDRSQAADRDFTFPRWLHVGLDWHNFRSIHPHEGGAEFQAGQRQTPVLPIIVRIWVSRQSRNPPEASSAVQHSPDNIYIVVGRARGGWVREWVEVAVGSSHATDKRRGRDLLARRDTRIVLRINSLSSSFCYRSATAAAAPGRPAFIRPE